MADSRAYGPNGDLHLAKSGGPERQSLAAMVNGGTKLQEIDVSDKYAMISPNGAQISIPKELFVALSDFMKTRKCPGSITIHFRSGEITCVEAMAKKTYRGNP